MISEYRWGIGVSLDSQATAPRLGARQLGYPRHYLQGERDITGDLRSSGNVGNIDAAPTHVVQQIVSDAEASPNAGLAFPKGIPSQGRAGAKETRATVRCEQRIANPRLAEQDPVWSRSETGGQVIVGMIAVRKLVTQPQTQGEVGPELHCVLHKPGSHPNPEGNSWRRRGHLEQRRFGL